MPRKKKTDIAPAPELNGPDIDKLEVPVYGKYKCPAVRLDPEVEHRLTVLAHRRETTVTVLANKLLRQVLKV